MPARLGLRLPRTPCHLDVWPGNLIRRPDGEVVFLDWAFTGDGAVGEDVGNLIPDSVLDRFLPHESLDELDAAVTDAYRGAWPTPGPGPTPGWSGSASAPPGQVRVAGPPHPGGRRVRRAPRLRRRPRSRHRLPLRREGRHARPHGAVGRRGAGAGGRARAVVTAPARPPEPPIWHQPPEIG
ncbi:phosphotransferase family protein [Streptomyces sp. NPDC050560]|uniref:phosphotransferase family protein n=1 Tax=Streptomyces sp. NPDC050560 TaxID=3365630 RepID=UPI00379E23E4